MRSLFSKVLRLAALLAVVIVVASVSYSTAQVRPGDFYIPGIFYNPAGMVGGASTFSGALTPLTTNTSDLGTTVLLWRNAYLAQTLFGTQGTVATSTPFLNLTSTWNAPAVALQGILLNVTDIASAASSSFLDLQKAGVSQFKVDKSGNITVSGTSTLTGGGGVFATLSIGTQSLPIALTTGTALVIWAQSVATSGDNAINYYNTKAAPSVAGGGNFIAGFYDSYGTTAFLNTTNAVQSLALNTGYNLGSGSLARAIGMTSVINSLLAGGVITTGTAIFIDTPNKGVITPGTITTQRGLYVANQQPTSVTTGTGILVDTQTGVGAILRSDTTSDFLQLQTSAGTNIFRFTSAPGMVNGLTFNAAPTGSGGQIAATGVDPSVQLWITSKGNGDINLYQSNFGATMANFAATPSQVDYFQFRGSAAANPATVTQSAVGTDLNINLNLVSKGTGTIQLNGTTILPVLSGTTASIGGAALVAGACSTGTITITGAATNMVAVAGPNTYPGDGTIWDAQVTSANTVTVKVCAIVALTPTASTYNVRVLQ